MWFMVLQAYKAPEDCKHDPQLQACQKTRAARHAAKISEISDTLQQSPYHDLYRTQDDEMLQETLTP